MSIFYKGKKYSKVAYTQIKEVEVDIDTSNATATAEDIKLNKTAYVDGKMIIGTFIHNGDSVEGVTEANRVISINGNTTSDKVEVNDNKQVVINSDSSVGLRGDNVVNVLPGANTTVIIPYSGPVVTANNLIPENIKKDVNILGTIGTYKDSGSGEDLIAALNAAY